MGRAERKDRDKREMRELILKAAKKLFVDKGFENITMRRIADEIEYSPGTVYLYFKDKLDILCALQEVGFAELYRRQQILLTVKNPAERLRACGKVYIDFAMENQELYDIMFIMQATQKGISWEADSMSIGKQSYEELFNIVKDCIDQGYMKKVQPEIATFMCWSLMHGIASIIIRERAVMIPKEHLPYMVDGVLDFLMSEILDKEMV